MAGSTNFAIELASDEQFFWGRRAYHQRENFVKSIHGDLTNELHMSTKSGRRFHVCDEKWRQTTPSYTPTEKFMWVSSNA